MVNFKEVKCRKCKIFFANEQEYRMHLIESKDHNACDQCFEDFLSLKALQQHVLHMHPVEQNLICKCGLKFVRAAGLVAHLDQRVCIGAPHMDIEVARVEAALQKSTLGQAKKPNNMSGAVQHETPPMANTQDPVDSDDDLIIFLDKPPNNGLPPDNDWSTAQIYAHLLAEASETKSGDQVTVKSNVENQAPISRPSVLPASTSREQVEVEPPIATQPSIFGPNSTFGRPVLPVNETSIQKLLSTTPVEEEIDEWAPATVLPPTPAKTGPLAQHDILDLIERERLLKVERDKRNPFHPSCPDFKAGKYWNSILKFYQCPYSRCGKTKPSLDAFVAHLLSPAHCGEEITCDVCLRTYPSPTAFAAHFEAQGKRCKAKYLGDDIISPLTGGVIKVVGENEDHTPIYGAWVDQSKDDTAAQLAVYEENEKQKRERHAFEESIWNERHPKW